MKCDEENIRAAIQVLFTPGDVVELRIPKAGKLRVVCGYFSDHEKLAVALARYSGEVEAIYYTINPVHPDLLARCNNREKPYSESSTKDSHILRRKWFFVDCDPVRIAGISSNSEEKKAAKALAKVIKAYLLTQGWPEAIICDSGNGYHLFFYIDLPNDDPARILIENVLKALAGKFNNEKVKVDCAVGNASRIVKAYGTMACKGDSTEERPHRVAQMFEPPIVIGQVTREQLELLAALAPRAEQKKATTAASDGGFTQEMAAELFSKFTIATLNERVFRYSEKPMQEGDRLKWQHDCLRDPEHHKPDGFTFLENGYVHHHCSHDSCKEMTDADWRELWEEAVGEKYPYPRKKQTQDNGKFDIESADQDGQTEMPASSETWEKLADKMMRIRISKEESVNAWGKTVWKEKPKVKQEKEVWDFALKIMQEKGKLFLDAYPFVFLPEESRIVKFHDNGEANALLFRLGLLVMQSHTNLVRENLSQYIQIHGTPTRVEKLGCMRGQAIYVNNGRGGMFKIEERRIGEVSNGTDDVYMLCPELTPWPELSDENIARMKVISQNLGKHGGKVGDSVLCRQFNAYFEEGDLNSQQYQQMVLLRYLSLFLGQAIDLRPIMFALGEQNSGKSTLWEKIKWTLEGTAYESSALPTNLRSFTAAITNSAMCIFDNIDSVNFSNAKSDYPAYIDLMCKAATGGQVPIAELYKTNVEKKFDLRSDLFLTARVNSFPPDRSDLGRRTLFFPIRHPSQNEFLSTELMKAQLRRDEVEMKLETLVRLQKVLRAMLAHQGKEYPPISQMHSYENWTMRVADYEEWIPEMQAIWKGYKGDAQERITEDSPFVEVIRRWLGMQNGKNVKRWARPGEIYRDLQMRYDREFTKGWANASVLGRRLNQNFSALRILGVERKKMDGGPVYCFTPDPTQLERCIASYHDSTPWGMPTEQADAAAF